jgi:hypothetical protein
VLYPVELRALKPLLIIFQQAAIPTSLRRCFPSVAIGAANLAFLHLGFDYFPRVIPQHITDVSSFCSRNMIEFKTNNVGLATVDTWMTGEIFHDHFPLRFSNRFIPRPCLGQVIRLILPIMLFYLNRRASSAACLSRTLDFALPIKLVEALALTTSGTEFFKHGTGRLSYFAPRTPKVIDH